MIKNKIIALVTCGVFVTAGIASGALISNKNTNEKTIQNHILLAAPNLNNLAVVINTNVNPLVLYSSPSSNSSIESYISVGEMLNYTPTNNPNFYKVTVQETGATGYISASNMQIIQSGLNKAYENTNKNGQVINVTYDVKLMSSPDVHSQILGSYKNNSPMIILGKQDQWYKVEIGDQTGYMYQSYVGIDNSSNAIANNKTNSSIQSNNIQNGKNTNNMYPSSVKNNSESLIGQKVFVIPNKDLNVYSSDNTKSSIIANETEAKLGMDVLNVINNNNDYNAADTTWYKVKLSNGTIGYVPQDLTYYKIIYSNPNDKIPVCLEPNEGGPTSTIIKNQKIPMYVIYKLSNVKNNGSVIPATFYRITLANGLSGFIS